MSTIKKHKGKVEFGEKENVFIHDQKLAQMIVDMKNGYVEVEYGIYYIFLVIVAGVVYGLTFIQTDFIRILVGAPFALLGVYSVIKILDLSFGERFKGRLLTGLAIASLWVSIIIPVIVVTIQAIF